MSKWTVNSISEATGYDRRTIGRVLTAAGIEREEIKLREFIDAFVAWNTPKSSGGRSELEREQTRLTKAKADLAEVERARARAEVIPVSTALAVWENVAASIRRIIETCNLSNEEKDNILKDLQSCCDPKLYEEQSNYQLAAEEN